MIEANRFKLGLFVVGGVLLIIVGLFVFGASRLFEDTVEMYTFFTESVQGLEEGAAVKFKGAAMGRVTRIVIRPENQKIRVDMKITLSTIEHREGKTKRASEADAGFFETFVQEEIKRGLRCQLALTGITGLKYVEVDYFNNGRDELMDNGVADDMIYIPSRPSALTQSLENINQTLTNLSAVDFQQMSAALTKTLDNINLMIGETNLSGLSERANGILANVEELTATLNKALPEDRLSDALDRFNKAADSVNKLAETTQREITSAKLSETAKMLRDTVTEAKLPEAGAALRDSMTSAKNAAAAIVRLEQNVADALDQFESTLVILREFVRYLDEDPSALLKGKQKPHVLE